MCDENAEAQTLGLGGTGRLCPPERVEQPVQRGLRNRHAVVVDLATHQAVTPPDADLDRSCRIAVVERVLDQVREDLRHAIDVPLSTTVALVFLDDLAIRM